MKIYTYKLAGNCFMCWSGSKAKRSINKF